MSESVSDLYEAFTSPMMPNWVETNKPSKRPWSESPEDELPDITVIVVDAPDTAPRSTRLRQLRIDGDLLLGLMGRGRHAFEVVENALPEDALILDARMERHVLILTIQSGEFEPVALGGYIPEIMPMSRAIECTPEGR